MIKFYYYQSDSYASKAYYVGEILVYGRCKKIHHRQCEVTDYLDVHKPKFIKVHPNNTRVKFIDIHGEEISREKVKEYLQKKKFMLDFDKHLEE